MFKSIPLGSRAETTALKQPKELFVYSRDENGCWNTNEEFTRSNRLPYYYFPDSYIDRAIDLTGGIKSFKKIPEEQNRADFSVFLRALQQYEQKSGKKSNAHIITFRGIMTKLLALPYDVNTPIHLYAIGYDGHVFIKQDDAMSLADPPDDYQHRCEYSGYKFETISTLPEPWARCLRQMIERRHKKTVSNYDQYISVVRSGIGKTRTLVAGEVDCIWDYLPNDSSPLDHYVELKTSRAVEHPGQAVTFEKKLYKTWAQCFLLGVKRIVYGFRDNNFLLRNVEVYNTDEVPLLLKDTKVPRQGAGPISCVNALKWYGAVLEWIKENIDPYDYTKAYKIQYDPGSRTFTLGECVGDENSRLRNGELLTEEFKRWRLEFG